MVQMQTSNINYTDTTYADHSNRNYNHHKHDNFHQNTNMRTYGSLGTTDAEIPSHYTQRTGQGFPIEEVGGSREGVGKDVKRTHTHTDQDVCTNTPGRNSTGTQLHRTRRDQPSAGSKKPTAKIEIRQGMLRETAEDMWDPKSMWPVLDGVESMRWAWTGLELGAEEDIITYTDWFVKKLRQAPNKAPHIKQLWDEAGLKIALALRENKFTNENCK